MSVKEFPVLRRINAALFLIISTALIAGIMAGQTLYGPSELSESYYVYGIGGAAGLCAIIASFALWQSKMKLGLISAGLAAIIMSVPTYQFILPNLEKLRVADQISTAFDSEDILLPRKGGPKVVSPHFTEPSLVYHLGGSIDVTDKVDLLDMEAFAKGRIIILDYEREGGKSLMGHIEEAAREAGLCTKIAPRFEGFNYSKGDPVEIAIARSVKCPEEAINAQSQPGE